MKPKIFILHILPIELFPPILNLLKYEKFNSSFSVTVFTSYNKKNRTAFVSDLVRIKRITYFGFLQNFFLKLILLFWYNIKSLYELVRNKPSKILYYEPHSSFPIYLYKRIFNPNVDLYIHYHELYTNADFDSDSMRSIKFFNVIEKKYLYTKAKWISQTNANRLSIFKEENSLISESILKVFPNYPPSDWNQSKNKSFGKETIRVVYFGALSFENTYIREIVSFFSQYPDLVEFDIFSYNLHDDVLEYLRTNTYDNIRFYEEGIEYFDIPKMSVKYDLGLILYKGHNMNYIYNAPNKLFEYLTCGLNVWFPEEILGCRPIINSVSTPYVENVDFGNLKDEVISNHFEKIRMKFIPSSYNCEVQFDKLIKSILN